MEPSRHNLLTGGPSSQEKHLNKFFKICNTGFWRLDLVTCSRLIPVAKNVCFALWGLFLGQFSKTLHFSLAYYDYSLSCPFLSLTNSPCSLQKNSPQFSKHAFFATGMSRKQIAKACCQKPVWQIFQNLSKCFLWREGSTRKKAVKGVVNHSE